MNFFNSLASTPVASPKANAPAAPIFGPGPGIANEKKLQNRLTKIQGHPFSSAGPVSRNNKTRALNRLKPFMQNTAAAAQLASLQNDYELHKRSSVPGSLNQIVLLNRIQKERTKMGLPEYVGGKRKGSRKNRKSRKTRRSKK